MPRVQIIQLGSLTPSLNLKGVARFANKTQTHFQFISGDPIEHLGDPDDEGKYKVRDLGTLLETRRNQGSVDVAVGVVDSPLYYELFSGVDTTNNNIVISTVPFEELPAAVKIPIDAYILVEIAAQLLTIEYRRQNNIGVEPEECASPWHGKTRSCLFDYCSEPKHTIKKLISHKVCPQCLALLQDANIRPSVTAACLSIAKEAVRLRLSNVLREILSDPLGRFAFGGLSTLLIVGVGAHFGLSPLQSGGVLSVLLLIAILWVFGRIRRKYG